MRKVAESLGREAEIDFIAEVDRARAQQWTAVGEIVLEVVRDLFDALYRGASFQNGLDANALVGVATPLPLAQPGQSLDDALNELIGGRALATGGGAVLRPSNRDALHSRTHALYLRSTPEEATQRPPSSWHRRTPRSTSRRAIRQRVPYSLVSGLSRPYIA